MADKDVRMITLFHSTSPERGNKIMRDGFNVSYDLKNPESTWFTHHQKAAGMASGSGIWVSIEIERELAEHYRYVELGEKFDTYCIPFSIANSKRPFSVHVSNE